MTDYSAVAPPQFLTALLGDVLNKKLQCIPLEKNKFTFRISLGPHTGKSHEGLFIHPKNQKGLHHHGLHWEEFHGKAATIGHAWGDNEDDQVVFEGDFETWVRGEVGILISRHLRSQAVSMLEKLRPDLSPKKKRQVMARCEEIIAATNSFSFWGDRELESIDYKSLLAPVYSTLWILKASLTELTEPEKSGLTRQLENLDGSLVKGNGYLPVVLRKGGLFSLVPEDMMASISHTLMFRVNKETRTFIEHYQKQPSSSKFEAFKKNIESCEPVFNDAACHLLHEASNEATSKEDVSDEQRRIQGLINEYNTLFRDFQTYSPTPKGADARGQRLVTVEQELNAYWSRDIYSPEQVKNEVRDPKSPMPTRAVLNIQAKNRAVKDGRFLSSGSSCLVGWFRNEGRFQEAVEYVMADTKDVDLCVLRNDAHPPAFQCYINNGLGSFLDSRQEKHIPLAVQVVDRLEKAISFEDSGLLYQITCVLARAEETERALDYLERAVKHGERIQTMARDSDLENIVHEPRFQTLLEAATSAAA